MSAFLFDVSVANWVHRSVPVARLVTLFGIMKAPGHFGLTLVIAAALLIWRRSGWRGAVFLCASGIVSGLFYTIMKWCVGRTRSFHGIPPFELHPFSRGIRNLFASETQSFPSGYMCLAFASAATLCVLLPRFRLFNLLTATITAIERVLQNSHYVSDVVAGAAVSVVAMAMCRLIWPVVRISPVACKRSPDPEGSGENDIIY